MTFGVRWLLRRVGICPMPIIITERTRKRDIGAEQLKEKILKIYHEYSENPGRWMMRVCLLQAKISLSHTTILKYMQELGIRSMVTPKKLVYKKGNCYKRFENHLNREFHAEKPYEKWCTDFTYIFMEHSKQNSLVNIIFHLMRN